MIQYHSKVYLAGPIAGLDYTGATEWRESATMHLAEYGIQGLSPMRAKEYLSGVQEFSADCVSEGIVHVLSTPRAVMTRDRFDATRADMLIVNLRGAARVSIGTVMEIAWADLSRIPVVLIMEPGNIHEHAMLEQAIGWRVETLEEALHIVTATLA